MRLLNSRKPRRRSRVSDLFSSSTVYDVGDDHAFSTSANGYGPQVISDAAFRPNNVVRRPLEEDTIEAKNAAGHQDSPVSDSSSIRRKYADPWSASTMSGPSTTEAPPRRIDREQEGIPAVGRDGLWSWIPHIAQSADDDTIRYRVKEVFLFTEQFVLNHYRDQVIGSEVLQEALIKVNRSQLLPTPQLQEYLAKAAYQTTVIKHVLLSLMLDLISFNSVGSKGSLLPREFQNYTALAKARTRSDADEIPRSFNLSRRFFARTDIRSRHTDCAECLPSIVSSHPSQLCDRSELPRGETTDLARLGC